MPSQPNVLFMIADDHRWDAIAGMGDLTVKTPVLGSLMKSGTTLHTQIGSMKFRLGCTDTVLYLFAGEVGKLRLLTIDS